MNNETLELGIQAKILPQIQGAAEFEQQLTSLPSHFQNRIQQVIESQGFEQGLADTQIAQAQDWMKYSQGIYEPFNNRISELLKDFSADIEGGSISKSQMGKYNRKLAKLRNDLEDFEPEIMDDAREFMSTLDPDRLTMVRGALKEARGDIENDVEGIKQKFQSLAETINGSNNEAKSLFTELRQAGIFAVGGMIASEGMKWIRTGAEIEAKERTAFDLTSPIGMYGEQRQFEVFESTRERERLYSAIGMAVGGALGSFLGPLGILGGGMFGGQIGGMVAGIFNLEEQSKMQEELKYLNQTWGTISGYVGQSQGYDISRARLRARFGEDALGSTGLGYTPEQEMNMRLGFSDALGRFDETKYLEQTTFARALGMDTGQIYGLNVSGRVTGADYGITGLDQARSFTKSIYGDDVSPARVGEVLNEIKLINEQMLRLNINADSRDGLRFAQLPTDLFGTDSPYGRLGDLGSTTLKNLEGLMMPRSGAHSAFLYQAMGTDNIMDYNEMMKGGIYSGDNFSKIMEGMKKTTGQDKFLSYFMLDEMMPKAPQGFNKDLAELISDDDKFKDFMTKFKEHEAEIKKSTLTEEEKQAANKKAAETLLGYTDAANKNISATEKMNEEISKKQNEVADLWRKTVNDASINMATFWEKLGKSSENFESITSKLNKGIELLFNKINPDYSRDKNIDETYDELIQDGKLREEDRNSTRDKILEQHRINEEKIKKVDALLNPGKNKDNVWWKGAFNNVSDSFENSALGSRYDLNMYEGYATDGHMKGSAHYSGDAFDFTVVDRETGKHIAKDQYPKELVEALKNIAERLGYEYGGNYKNPDNNHFEKGSGKAPVTVEFHNIRYEDAQKISNMEIVVRQPGFNF